VAENLRQAHEVVARVFQVAVRHRVPQQVRVNVEPADRSVLAAQVAHASVGQRTSFTDEDEGALHRRPTLQVRLKRLPGLKRERNRALLAAFAEPEDDGAAPLTQHEVAKFEADPIADTTSGKQKEVEDRCRPDIATEFDPPLSGSSDSPLSSGLLVRFEEAIDGRMLAFAFLGSWDAPQFLIHLKWE
jgi:hypothetical protein